MKFCKGHMLACSSLNQLRFLCASSDFGPNPGIVEEPGDLALACFFIRA